MIVRLRPATTLDLDVLAAVEVACFEAPWSREVLAQDLERPIARVVVVAYNDIHSELKFHDLLNRDRDCPFEYNPQSSE